MAGGSSNIFEVIATLLFAILSSICAGISFTFAKTQDLLEFLTSGGEGQTIAAYIFSTTIIWLVGLLASYGILFPLRTLLVPARLPRARQNAPAFLVWARRYISRKGVATIFATRYALVTVPGLLTTRPKGWKGGLTAYELWLTLNDEAVNIGYMAIGVAIVGSITVLGWRGLPNQDARRR